VKLATELKKADTSSVRTINRPRTEIPPSIKNARGKLYDSQIYKHDHLTLTVYQGKVNKNVLLFSSQHTNVNTANSEKTKPDTVAFYYGTKFDVGVLNHMVNKILQSQLQEGNHSRFSLTS